MITALPGQSMKPILISCHNRIEERDDYENFVAARRRNPDATVPCRYLGSGDTVQVAIKDLNPSHFESSLPQFVIINDGECCHYQIEGGVFTDEILANQFADGLAAIGRYKREHLRVTLVKTNPKLSDFRLNTLKKPETSIWPRS